MKRKRVLLFLVSFCALVMASATFAQSTDQSNPTAITANELVIAGPKKNNQLYFYSFSAGPGEVTLSLNVKAKSSSTFVGIKIFDSESNTLAYHNMSADTGSPGIALKKFEVGEKQTLTMSFTSDPSLGECRIKFGGAVELGSAEVSSTSNLGVISETNATMSNASTSTMTDQTSTTSSPGKNKNFMFSILDAAGQRFNIPTSGKLLLEMKDGTSQEIDLVTVKKITVKH